MPESRDFQSKENKNRGIKILIVDDMPQVRRDLRTVLAMAAKSKIPGAEVIAEASDGEQALELADLANPDVVLMDLEMPRMDGISATHVIKKAHPLIGVIILTIHGDDETRRQAALAGADAFIEKGSQINELIEAINKYRRTS